MGISVLFVFIASTATVFWGPGANGSGVAELMGYLNGINYPGLFGFETYVTKVFGVVLAVCGGLCVGKEGPLAHIGAIVGIVTAYLPLPRHEFLQNDTFKRRLISAGTSAGVSCAFGAPIGGTLFAYEISKPNNFWKFSVLWKVFFTCAIAVFSLAIFGDLMDGDKAYAVTSSTLKFGYVDIAPPTLLTLPGAIMCGCICGCLGALFIFVNSNLAWWRKHNITKPWVKVAEALFFSALTTSFFFWMPKITDQQCQDASIVSPEN